MTVCTGAGIFSISEKRGNSLYFPWKYIPGLLVTLRIKILKTYIERDGHFPNISICKATLARFNSEKLVGNADRYYDSLVIFALILNVLHHNWICLQLFKVAVFKTMLIIARWFTISLIVMRLKFLT